ncbi:hypothetical protein BASA50_001303 [Batrachochytrium salamandrivorans]|uniref:Ketoreductase domain-containing protein n=1 Tax=Batrachochytrium salamandrivorans TaxID=1357716 RepID=A0ABQ8EVK5_9FUNG|nr:hypothetical protein BASA62_008253 [Batrachochytrium salamandrivorans]KAH6573908.1 hypothetical protein BASA60_005805 [Batrachochytrium salamandrivorans]KAH6587297.1 hypothetical protein BASA50_001303 [Batrachochytrium salamandrivorans]KAH6597785.1 hypothetical protein BASA61_003049 [Batrachochytrium salamandrivorans]KAH9266162.1 hypothetical protein BASA84_001206 [Batrachochytrium salamandrivorans]
MNSNTLHGLAVVTGASRGIGLAVARCFVKAGIPIVLVSRQISLLETARTQLETARTQLASIGPAGISAADASSHAADIHIRAVNIADSVAVESLCKDISSIGPVRYLVNCAGISSDSLLLSITAEDMHATIDTNLVGTMLMCKGMVRSMIKAREGSIVNVASIIGVRTGNSGQTAYAASKAGLIGFTSSLARELAGKGIRVNAIAPGFIDTDMTKNISDLRRQALLESIPLRRFGTADEIAQGVMYLLNAPFTTGQCLTIDGGQTA